MLPLKMMIRLSPNLMGATAFRLNSSSSSGSSVRYITSIFSESRTSPMQLTANSQNDFTKYPIVPFKLITQRFYTKDCKQSSTSTAASNTPPPPTRGKNPSNASVIDKEQLEKIFFRVLAFIWDTTVWVFTGLKNFYENNIMGSPTVQIYLKKLQDKMDKAKKDW